MLLVGIFNPLFAFQFSPLEQEFSPSGADSTKTYTIVNDSGDSIAVEVSALTRDLIKDGAEANESAPHTFLLSQAK